MEAGRRLFALCAALLLAVSVAAAPVVRVVGPEPVLSTVLQQLSARAPGVEVRSDAGPAQLVVAVGARAFRDALLADEGLPVIGVTLTRESYRLALHEVVDRADNTRAVAPHTALYWEPNPVRQLELARLLLPGAKRVGILPGAATDPALLAALRAECARLEFVPVLPDDKLRRRALPQQLAGLLADSDFLLGIDSADIFSPANAKTILLTAYRKGRPVIGPGGAWVDAGSMASLSAGLPETVDALADWLPQLLAGGALPPPRYLERYSVVTNPQVARSLSITLPPDERLRSLRSAGGTP